LFINSISTAPNINRDIEEQFYISVPPEVKEILSAKEKVYGPEKVLKQSVPMVN